LNRYAKKACYEVFTCLLGIGQDFVEDQFGDKRQLRNEKIEEASDQEHSVSQPRAKVRSAGEE
jgi:hypothetical protein